MSMPDVLGGQYDIYLTTYEMLITMEGFFTENFLWHTITIDEGHRIKNDGAKLVASLARISAPFRLLLTGTPLQNNLNELWSLMHYILPVALKDCKETFEQACVVAEGQLDKTVTRQARALLESMMLRRVKADVEASLRPKIQYVLKVPLSGLQRRMYRLFLDQNSAIEGLASKTQIISMCAQLQKTINHPKTILFDVERRRKAARELVKKAAGAEFFSLPECLQEQSASSKQLEQELGLLQGRALVAASGKCSQKSPK
jgi:SNF2 family DNA or RNA helicase